MRGDIVYRSHPSPKGRTPKEKYSIPTQPSSNSPPDAPLPPAQKENEIGFRTQTRSLPSAVRKDEISSSTSSPATSITPVIHDEQIKTFKQQLTPRGKLPRKYFEELYNRIDKQATEILQEVNKIYEKKDSDGEMAFPYNYRKLKREPLGVNEYIVNELNKKGIGVDLPAFMLSVQIEEFKPPSQQSVSRCA